MWGQIVKKNILGMEVETTSVDDALLQIKNWAGFKGDKPRSARYVCASNVHMCMEAYDNLEYLSIVNNADLVLPDGKPIIWAQRLLGAKQAKQVRGMDIMLEVCEYASQANKTIGLYGGTPDLLEELSGKLLHSYPKLQIVSQISPPFRELTATEDAEIIREINASKVDILFVGIGCPKQERWMAAHKSQFSCVMLGVGAAFDFITGRKKIAPTWMQYLGLEWLFRFFCEPRRLWKRYLKHNPRFLALFFVQLVKARLFSNSSQEVEVDLLSKNKIFGKKRSV